MYSSFYGFSARPFRLNPDPHLFFHSLIHDRALAYLRYGLSQGEGFVVITGDPGTGKTQLMRTLVAEHPAPQLETIEIVTSLLDGDEILQLLSASLNIPTHGVQKGEQLALLRNHLLSRARLGGRVLVLIDEAHDLSPRAFEELRMLSNLQFSGRTPLQCFLLGHTVLLQRLGMPDMLQFQQRVIATCHLHALSSLETRQYVELRLTHVNWKGTPHFTDAAFALLHQYTGGVPRRINTFCDRLLLFAAMEGLRTIDEHTEQAVIQELKAEMDVRDPSDARFADELCAEHLSARDVIDASARPTFEPELQLAAEPASLPNPPLKPQQNSAPHAHVVTPPVRKIVTRSDANVIDADEEVPTLMERVQSWHHAAPIAADKALVHLRHAWQTRRRIPTWTAVFTTGAAALAIFVMLKLTHTPEKHSPAAQLPVESATHPRLITQRVPGAEQPDGLAARRSATAIQVSTQAMPPSADLGDDVIASIAPFVSAASGAPVTEGALSQFEDQAQDLPETDHSAPVLQSSAMRVATLPSPARRKPASMPAVAKNAVHVLGPPPLLLAKTPDLPLPLVAQKTAARSVPATTDASAVNRPAETRNPTPPKSSVISEVARIDASARFSTTGADVASVAVDPLKRAKLTALLTQFESAYQAGNVPQLTRLFAADARTTDAQGRGEILRVYQQLFEVTDRREIGIDNVAWEIREGQVHGAAHFVVTVLEKGARVPRSYTGALSIVVKPEQENLTISQLYHAYASR